MKPGDPEQIYEIEHAVRNPRDGKLVWRTFEYAPSLAAAQQKAGKTFNDEAKWRIRSVTTVSVSRAYRAYHREHKGQGK